MRYLSLFSGSGGAELAMGKVFPEASCVGFSEIDDAAKSAYLQHFPGHKDLGRVENVGGHALQPVDIVIGGSPCQGFSLEGSRRGLDDERSGLFWHFVRLLKETRARYFILENVASIPKSDLQLIEEALGCRSVLINSKHFTPQARRRLYWCNFPMAEARGDGGTVQDILVRSEKRCKWKGIDTEYMRMLCSKLTCPSTFNQASFGGELVPRTDGKCNAVTCKISQRDIIYDGEKLRYLECAELEKLQGFPLDYTARLGETNRRKVLGNAFTVPVLEHCLKSLKDAQQKSQAAVDVMEDHQVMEDYHIEVL